MKDCGTFTKKFVINKMDFPVDGYKYNVQEWFSVDGGKSFYYCGFGRFCKTLADCKKYISNVQKEE